MGCNIYVARLLLCIQCFAGCIVNLHAACWYNRFEIKGSGNFTVEFFLGWNYLSSTDALLISCFNNNIALIPPGLNTSYPNDGKHTQFLNISHFNYGWNRISLDVRNNFYVVNNSEGETILDGIVEYISSQTLFYVKGLHSLVNCDSDERGFLISGRLENIPLMFVNNVAFVSLRSLKNDLEVNLEIGGKTFSICKNKNDLTSLFLSSKKWNTTNCKIAENANYSSYTLLINLNAAKKDFCNAGEIVAAFITIEVLYKAYSHEQLLFIYTTDVSGLVTPPKLISSPSNQEMPLVTTSTKLDQSNYNWFLTGAILILIAGLMLIASVILFWRNRNQISMNRRCSYIEDFLDDEFNNRRQAAPPVGEEYENESDCDVNASICVTCGRSTKPNQNFNNPQTGNTIVPETGIPPERGSYVQPTFDSESYELPPLETVCYEVLSPETVPSHEFSSETV